MSREIKFRGKRIGNGEWVEGDLTRYSKYMSYITVDLVEGEVYEVLTPTVGQYTGLHDKNGTEIYEGDIVRALVVGGPFGGVGGFDDDKTGYWEGVVHFVDGCFEIKFDSTRDYLKCHTCNYAIEVIGNIHDNPELIGGDSP